MHEIRPTLPHPAICENKRAYEYDYSLQRFIKKAPRSTVRVNGATARLLCSRGKLIIERHTILSLKKL